MPDDLTPEELEAEAQGAEALPERAAMSTLNITSLDAAGGAVEAVGDGVPDAAAAEHGPPAHAVAAGHDPAHAQGPAPQANPAATAAQAASAPVEPAPADAPQEAP